MLKLSLYLLAPFIFALMATFAVAQTLTEVIEMPAGSVGAYAWKMLMLVITLGGSSLTPYATKYLTMGVLKVIGMAKATVPGPVLVCISTIISGVFAGVMGSETELPLHGDSAALMGATLGGAAQKFAHNDPAEIKPQPETAEPTAPPAAGLSAFWLPLLLIGGLSLSACSALSPMLGGSKNQLESVVGVVFAGQYKVQVSRDGVVIVEEIWTCSTDGQKLTGCHKVTSQKLGN